VKSRERCKSAVKDWTDPAASFASLKGRASSCGRGGREGGKGGCIEDEEIVLGRERRREGGRN